jgi:carboxyl-terminal processing protease
LEVLDQSSAILSIGFFNEETPRLVEKAIVEINKLALKNLIVDVRDNSGGGFEQAIKVCELFLPKDKVILSTKGRGGNVEVFKSNGGLLNPEVKLFVLTDKETSSGAEFFAAALKESRNARLVGEKTLGKWNVQRLETLPNHFAFKFTVQEFRSPNGNSYQGKGLKPDVEIVLPDEVLPKELKLKKDMAKRLDADTQLRAVLELLKLN